MSHDTHRSAAARRLIVIFGITCLGFGVTSLLFPEQVAMWVDIQLTSSTALADLRAVYGGVSLGAAALFLHSLRDPRWLAPSLCLAMAVSAGPASARLYSIAVSGMPNRLLLSVLAIEIASFAWTLRVYRALNASASTRPNATVQTAS